MDAPASASTMPGGWDINSSQPVSSPALHFTSTFDIKTPTMIESQLKSHLNVGLAPSVALSHNLGDYLANHSHRLMAGSNLGQPSPMIGLRTTDTGYYMKDFAPRSEDIVSLFEHSRMSRRGDEDVSGTDGSNGAGLSTPTGPDSRFPNDADVSVACLSQFSSRLLPTLAVEKNAFCTNDSDVKVEGRGHFAGNEDKIEDATDDDDDDNDYNDDDGEEEEVEEEDAGGEDDDEIASAWPGHTPGGLVASKGMIVIRQPASVRGSSPIACQDCGNQAKKDCVHMRCRTCCNGRGLDCATHVKSTWVPAYKRRQRQQLLPTNADQSIKLLCSRSECTARPSLDRGIPSEATNPNNSHTSTSTGTPPPSSDLKWLQQDGRFKRPLPLEVREQAVFKCVKISGVNDGIEEFAYQAVVKIGGRTYKGMLYDHGAEKGQSSASSIAELCLGGRHAVPSSSAGIDLAVNLQGTSESVRLEGSNATH